MLPLWPTALPVPKHVVSAHRAGREWFRQALSARELRSEDEQEGCALTRRQARPKVPGDIRSSP
jgi:hypothetical protein